MFCLWDMPNITTSIEQGDAKPGYVLSDISIIAKETKSSR